MVKRIAVDIGNSTIACALFDDGALLHKWYHSVKETAEAALSLVSKHKDEGVSTVAVSTVVPSAKADLLDRLKQAEVPTTEISLATQMSISNTYPTLGHDRLANTTAALKLYVKDVAEAGIVIDFGTATTLTAVSSSGRLLGGLITLGLKETLKAIYTNTDQLPLLDVKTVFQPDKIDPLATTTNEAILNGTILAQIALVERWIEESRKRIDGSTVVVATGGLSHFFSDALTGSIDHFDSDLTLKGINIIAAEVADLMDQG
jgi:type III pantothenate kinase